MARGAADAALLSAFGSLLFLVLILRDRGSTSRRVAFWSIAAAALFTLVWSALEAAQLGGSVLDLGIVLRTTLFGQFVIARLVLLAAAFLLLAVRLPLLATIAAGLALVSQAGHGHALAMNQSPSPLLFSEILHLLAAGAWLGGLLPLACFIAQAPAGAGATAARRFGWLGTLCVLLIAATALLQSATLIGSVAGLVGTAYGLVALSKLGLFLLLLALAARNRWRLVPALADAAPAKARLVRSVALETGVGLLTVLAAGLLTCLEPSMHAQPIWPFDHRFSLELVSEEPDFRREVLVAAAAMLAALVLAAAALVLGWRLRYALAALVPVVFWFALPHLDLLFAPAHSTQFWVSPTMFSSESIAQGATLYPQYCAACHGPRGHGDGPAAASLPVPPADLTAPHLWAHPDGELFWWLSYGIEGPEGGLVMPGFAGALSEDQRWSLIDAIRANNAGQARLASGDWPFPVQAPGLDLACLGPDTTTLADLHGRVVRLVFGPAASVDGAVTVAIDPSPIPGRPSCDTPGIAISATPGGWARAAYASVAGVPPEALNGTTVLVDAAGWLRAVLRAGSDELAGTVRSIAAQPLAANPPGHAGMKM